MLLLPRVVTAGLEISHNAGSTRQDQIPPEKRQWWTVGIRHLTAEEWRGYHVICAVLGLYKGYIMLIPAKSVRWKISCILKKTLLHDECKTVIFSHPSQRAPTQYPRLAQILSNFVGLNFSHKRKLFLGFFCLVNYRPWIRFIVDHNVLLRRLQSSLRITYAPLDRYTSYLTTRRQHVSISVILSESLALDWGNLKLV